MTKQTVNIPYVANIMNSIKCSASLEESGVPKSGDITIIGAIHDPGGNSNDDLIGSIYPRIITGAYNKYYGYYPNVIGSVKSSNKISNYIYAFYEAAYTGNTLGGGSSGLCLLMNNLEYDKFNTCTITFKNQTPLGVSTVELIKSNSTDEYIEFIDNSDDFIDCEFSYLSEDQEEITVNISFS